MTAPSVGQFWMQINTGQIAWNDLGLYYYKARVYHPKLGRFLQTDPVGYEDQMNLYAYVGNDPVNMIDPSGKVGCSGLCIAAVAAARACASNAVCRARAIGLGKSIIGALTENDKSGPVVFRDIEEKNRNNQYAKRNKKLKNKNNPNKNKTQRGGKNVKGDNPQDSKAEQKTRNERPNRATKDDNLKPKKEDDNLEMEEDNT